MLLFDAHLDLAMNALEWDRNLELEIKDLRALEENMSEPGRARGTTTLPEMRSGEVFLSVVTVISRTARPGLSTGAASQEISCARARGQLAYYRLLESQGKVHIITRSDQITDHKSKWESGNVERRLGFIISMEGADPIVWPEQVHEWYDLGLRQISLSHYGVSTYSHGTGTDGGVTKSGISLLKEMEKARIALDLTHLADIAFWEALDNSRLENVGLEYVKGHSGDPDNDRADEIAVSFSKRTSIALNNQKNKDFAPPELQKLLSRLELATFFANRGYWSR